MNADAFVPAAFDERSAREVLMVQAFETLPGDSPLWTAEDRDWATRLARETVPAQAPPQRFLTERARHALQRLRPRDAMVGRWLDHRVWANGWVLLAVAAGCATGIAVDAIGSAQRINLLAPPVWAAIGWNLVVYAALALALVRSRGAQPAAPGRLRRWVQVLWLHGPDAATGSAVQACVQGWARLSAPLALARATLLLHAAAAALGAGLIFGLYLRGLVLDYRAGWQSTFLDAGTVHALLSTLLAPAVSLSGVALPTVEVLASQQVLPGAAAAASAAPWIHLYATMLLLFVVLPRVLLGTAAAWQAARLRERLMLPLDSPYFRRLLQGRAGGPAIVDLRPYGAEVPAQSALALRQLLARHWGVDLQLRVAAATAHGDESAAPAAAGVEGSALRVALFDLAATPEAEAQGRFVQALRSGGGPPLLVLVDEAAFLRRFAGLPDRLAERRTAWRRWADAQGVVLLSTDLGAPELAAADAAFAALAA